MSSIPISLPQWPTHGSSFKSRIMTMASTHGSHNVPGTGYSLTLTTAQEAGASLSPPQKENTALRFMTCAEACGQALHPVSSEDGPSPGKDRGGGYALGGHQRGTPPGQPPAPCSRLLL